MVWRSRDGGADAESTTLDDLIWQLEKGQSTAETRLQSHYSEGGDQAAEVLDLLGASAAAGSPYSLEMLLGLVADGSLARPAIARHVQDRELVEEVEQEVLISVARSIHRYRSESRFTTWLFSLARNTAISEVRRQRPTTNIADDDVLGDFNARRMSSLVAERDMVREAIDSLPAVFRETVLLRDVERLSYSEIAERQGLAINTVRSRLSRGRALLAAKLPDQSGA